MVLKYIVGQSDTQDENVGETMHKRTEDKPADLPGSKHF
jgi:hypothetical protein